MRISELIQETSFVKYPAPRPHDPSRPLGRSEVLGPDGMVYHFMDPRGRGEQEKPQKFEPSKVGSSEHKPRELPEPYEPWIKDGKIVGKIVNGKPMLMSKSDAVGPDGKIYNWLDPRVRKDKTPTSFKPQATEEDSVNEELTDLARIAVQAVKTGDLEQWMELDAREKAKALDDAGYIHVQDNDWYGYVKSSSQSDRKLNQLMQQHQDDAYQLSMGAAKRAELKSKADELAEMQREKLRAEKLEDQKIAYEKYKDDAERKDAMDKIDKEYKHSLEMVNTEHRNNMEAIRTGNKHEIEKINLDHEEAARERAHELEKDQRNNDREDQRRRDDRDSEGPMDFPEPEDDEQDDEQDDTEGEPFRPQAPAGPALSAPKPDKKPSKYDNSDAIDVDAREVPDDDEEDDKKPLALPKPSTESTDILARIRQLAGM